jgi:CheY-like chemotaxis protein
MCVILVVEDDEGNRFALEELLKMEGYEVVSVSGGRDAIDVIRKKEFDLILCDITMPGITGYNVITEAKELYPKTPFIFVSAHVRYVDQKIGFKLGADRYITKPYSISDILGTIRDVLRK